MKINYIELENYRNIEKSKIFFSDGLNVIEGQNAQGKTNALEAIYYTALGKSFRHVPDLEIIQKNCDFSKIFTDFSDSLRRQNIEIVLQRKKGRLVKVNGVPMEKLSELIGRFRAVLFSPEHLSLIKEGPSMRRNFLDVAVSQIDEIYLKELQRYSKILSQRAALLKSVGQGERISDADEGMLGVLTSQLCESAGTIICKRLAYIKDLKVYVEKFFADMSQATQVSEAASVEYSSDYIPRDIDLSSLGGEISSGTAAPVFAEALRKKLDSAVEREFVLGTTLYGPHRDDIEIMLNGYPARYFASQGQQRTLALALKLSEGEISFSRCGEAPVYLLDDMLSELDGKRRDFLLGCLSDRQIIVTACEKISGVPAENIIHAEGGCFC